MHIELFVHILTHNSGRYIRGCLESLLEQEGFVPNKNLLIYVTDNNSDDNTVEQLKPFLTQITFRVNSENLGYSAGHNQGAAIFLDSFCTQFLVLNPDVKLEKGSLVRLAQALGAHPEAGFATPKLFRADETFLPVLPPVLDAAGMVLENSLRHFDRGSQQTDIYFHQELVFGGTGACLLMKRNFVKEFSLTGRRFDLDKCKIYPQLCRSSLPRAQLFDEAFFAYREDADLAWRARNRNTSCLFVPEAIGYHVRKVLPEARSEQPAIINGMSVRNRFLLQLNNYQFSTPSFFSGIIFRNLLVVVGVLIKERTSLSFLWQIPRLFRRALERRRLYHE